MPHPRATNSNVMSSLAMSFSSLGRGMMLNDDASPRSNKTLLLYDIENCPDCRLVREKLCELQQDVEIRPVPEGGGKFTGELSELAGSDARAPVLHDSESGQVLVGVDQALGFLGAGRATALMRWTSRLTSKLRHGQGERAEANTSGASREVPELTLYSFEPSPYARLVRERLCELELAYTCYQMPRDSWRDVGPPELRLGGSNWEPAPGSRRETMLREYNKIQVPFLIVGPGDEHIFGTSRIIARLENLAGA